MATWMLSSTPKFTVEQKLLYDKCCISILVDNGMKQWHNVLPNTVWHSEYLSSNFKSCACLYTSLLLIQTKIVPLILPLHQLNILSTVLMLSLLAFCKITFVINNSCTH